MVAIVVSPWFRPKIGNGRAPAYSPGFTTYATLSNNIGPLVWFANRPARVAAARGVVFLRSIPMSDCDQSMRLSCDERLSEIAAIFAKGVVRLHERAALPSGESP